MTSPHAIQMTTKNEKKSPNFAFLCVNFNVIFECDSVAVCIYPYGFIDFVSVDTIKNGCVYGFYCLSVCLCSFNSLEAVRCIQIRHFWLCEWVSRSRWSHKICVLIYDVHISLLKWMSLTSGKTFYVWNERCERCAETAKRWRECVIVVDNKNRKKEKNERVIKIGHKCHHTKYHIERLNLCSVL